MHLDLTDTAEIRGARITRDGFLVADALVARANNIQTYTAGELGLTDRAATDTIRVFRPEAEVFAADSMASAAHRPITLGHPSVMVDAKNWREYAKGDMGADIVRDGEFVRVPIKVMDAPTVDAVLADHREFSMGYTADFELTPGTFNGQAYDASVKNLRYNHLAACRAARGGSQLRIVDERRDDAQPGDRTMKTLTLDGLQVTDVSAPAEAAIIKLQGQLKDAQTAQAKAETDLAASVTTAATKDAEIATLKTQLADAALTPAKLQDAAKAYATVTAQAKALGATVTDGMDSDAIKAAVVTAKLGDAAKGWTADQIATSFATLTAGLKVDDAAGDPLRSVMTDGIQANTGDGASVRDFARSMQYN